MKWTNKLKDIFIKKILKDKDYYFNKCLKPPFPEKGDFWRTEPTNKEPWHVWNGKEWIKSRLKGSVN